MRAACRALALAAVLLSATIATSALARGPTEAERANLSSVVAAFDKTMQANDFPGLLEFTPPKILQLMAENAGVDVKTIRQATIKEAKTFDAATYIKGYGMELAKAKHLTLANGEPYALIPTWTLVEVEGTRIRNDSQTVAVLDSGKWYLVRIADAAQATLLAQAYPEFSGVSFPGPTTKVIR